MLRSIVWCALVTLVCASCVHASPGHSHAKIPAPTTLQTENARFSHLHQSMQQAVQGVEQHVKAAVGDEGYTPSATPLVLLSPEVSVWSFSDSLFSAETSHWSGGNMTMNGAISVDEKVYQFLGSSDEFTAEMTQQNKMVMPTSTYYSFITPEGVELQILFTSVVDIVNEESELYRPYSYVTLSVNNTDANQHAVKVYYEVSSDWVLDQKFNPDQNIIWTPLTSFDEQNWVANEIRNYDNIPFSEKGDYVKMNWGSVYMASPPDRRITHTLSGGSAARTAFAAGESLPGDDPAGTRRWKDDPVSSAFAWNFGALAQNQATGAYVLIAFDDSVSMDYFGEYQLPLWKQFWNDDVHAMILDGLSNWQTLLNRCLAFDSNLFNALKASGGVEYAMLTSLAYRQVTAGIKGVWSTVANESRWYMKEISSDGDVSTVDVIYPASPFFLAFAPEILRKMLLPLLDYGLNRTNIAYNLPWAPHHLGIWPVSDITPNEQEQMPMEESGNMFLMLNGIVAAQKGNVTWLEPYWGILQTWGEYLISSLPDPGNQLCTDDFEGPSPHNVNLALKGILGLESYAQLLTAAGQQQQAQAVHEAAVGFANQWISLAADANHTRLQYDLPGTWSMKYNALFQYILGLEIFPPTVMEQEVAFYKTQLTEWGLPLDSRGPLTKTDWTSWIAAMSTDQEFSTTLFQYLLKFVMQSPSRGVPFSDWYATDTGKVLGFRARPVQGGLFAKYLLTNQEKNRSDHANAAGGIAFK